MVNNAAAGVQPQPTERDSFASILLVYLRLGLTSFGGPIAHLGYFRDEFVVKRRWLAESAFADLVALCQFLPGPASSQVGAALGILRGGLAGGFAAWLGFTLPSAVALTIFGLGLQRFSAGLDAGWLHGLKLVAVAIVAQALWGMGRNLCPDARRATVAIVAAAFVAAFPIASGQIAVIVAGGLCGLLLLGDDGALPHVGIQVRIKRRVAVAAIVLYGVLLVVLPIVAVRGGSVAQLFERFYRAGALVFGGGHVVLPLLQAQMVPTGMMSNDVFLAGYGAAQAVPGPLFALAAYLGVVANPASSGVIGGVVALVAIFLPGLLLLIGVLPFWENLRRHHRMRAAMKGINAAVVGILLAAFYQPVWTSAIKHPADFIVASAALLALVMWRAAPWLVVLAGACAGILLAAFAGGLS